MKPDLCIVSQLSQNFIILSLLDLAGVTFSFSVSLVTLSNSELESLSPLHWCEEHIGCSQFGHWGRKPVASPEEGDDEGAVGGRL